MIITRRKVLMNKISKNRIELFAIELLEKLRFRKLGLPILLMERING